MASADLDTKDVKSAVRTCVKCKTPEVATGAKFCAQCGEKMPDPPMSFRTLMAVHIQSTELVFCGGAVTRAEWVLTQTEAANENYNLKSLGNHRAPQNVDEAKLPVTLIPSGGHYMPSHGLTWPHVDNIALLNLHETRAALATNEDSRSRCIPLLAKCNIPHRFRSNIHTIVQPLCPERFEELLKVIIGRKILTPICGHKILITLHGISHAEYCKSFENLKSDSVITAKANVVDVHHFWGINERSDGTKRIDLQFKKAQLELDGLLHQLPTVFYYAPGSRELFTEFELLDELKLMLATFAVDLVKHTTPQPLNDKTVRLLTPALEMVLGSARKAARAVQTLAAIPLVEGFTITGVELASLLM